MRFPSGQKHRHWGRAFMTSWQLIFLQSRVNNGAYAGDYLPAQKWDWPRDTWFQTRLCYQRVQRGEMPGIVREPWKLTEDRPIPGRKESLTLDQRRRCVGASAGSENTRARIKTVKSPSSNITLWNAASLISVGFENSAVRMRTRRMAARSYVESPGQSVSSGGNGRSLPATPERLVELNQ